MVKLASYSWERPSSLRGWLGFSREAEPTGRSYAKDVWPQEEIPCEAEACMITETETSLSLPFQAGDPENQRPERQRASGGTPGCSAVRGPGRRVPARAVGQGVCSTPPTTTWKVLTRREEVVLLGLPCWKQPPRHTRSNAWPAISAPGGTVGSTLTMMPTRPDSVSPDPTGDGVWVLSRSGLRAVDGPSALAWTPDICTPPCCASVLSGAGGQCMAIREPDMSFLMAAYSHARDACGSCTSARIRTFWCVTWAHRPRRRKCSGRAKHVSVSVK